MHRENCCTSSFNFMFMARFMLPLTALTFILAIFFPQASLAASFPITGPEDFVRETGPPVEVSRSFTIRNFESPFILRIDNGGSEGQFGRVSSAVVTLNGEIVLAAPSDFNQTVDVIEREVSLAPENELMVEVRSIPGSGFTLTISGEAPEGFPAVEISSPLSGLVTAETQIDVSGVTSGFVDSVVVNGVAAKVLPGTFLAKNVPLEEGTNTLTATGMNPLGESASDSVTVRRDTSPPLVVIETPRNGDRLVSEMVTVAGTVNDIIPGATVNQDDVSVTVNGFPASVNNRTFIFPDLALDIGSNTITAVAVDRVGNSAQASIQITREPDLAGVRLMIVQGNNQSGPISTLLPLPLAVRAEDPDGQPLAGRPLTFEVSRGDGLLGNPSDNLRRVNLLTDGSGEASLDFTLGSRTGQGFHRVRVTTPGSLTFAEFCATAEPTEAFILSIVTMTPSQGLVNQPLTEPIGVIATDQGGNPVPGVPVTFSVDMGGGNLGNGQESLIILTDSDGIALAEWVLGPLPGVVNNQVSANFAGNTGLPAVFSVSGVASGIGEDTTVTGVVQDSSGNPLESVKTVVRDTEIEVFTGSDGRFILRGVPPGGHRIGVLGSNANADILVPDGKFFPDIDFEVDVFPGVENKLDQIVVLPLLDRESRQLVGGEEDVILTMANTPGFAIRVFAHSVILPDGTRGEIEMSSSQVKFDKVPMPPPQGSTPLVVGTLQPAGIRFDPPAQVIYPNVEGLAPGDVADIFAFHHDIGQFVNVGPGTVSEDGSVVVSDPGFGLTQSGWHCLIRLPGPAGECQNCDCDSGACQTCEGGDCVFQCESGCETCQDGSCISMCDSANCLQCQDGSCISSCESGCEECQDGTCVPIVEVGNPVTGSFEIDFSALGELLEVATEVAGSTGFCDASPPGNLSVEVSQTLFEECCEGEVLDLESVSGALNTGLGSASCDIPFLGIPHVASLNVRFGVSANLAFSIDATQTCTSSELCGSVGISASAQGGVSGTLGPSALLGSISAVLQVTGLGGTGSYCTQSGGSGQLCVGSVDVVGEVTLLTFIEESISFNVAAGVCSPTVNFG